VETIKPTTTRSLARLGSGSNAMIHKVCPHLKVHLTAAYMKSNRSGALEMKITRWRLRSNTADGGHEVWAYSLYRIATGVCRDEQEF